PALPGASEEAADDVYRVRVRRDPGAGPALPQHADVGVRRYHRSALYWSHHRVAGGCLPGAPEVLQHSRSAGGEGIVTLFVESREDVGRLERAIEELWDLAHKAGLDPFPTHFELVPATIMYEFGAYGLPGRFSHWTHGRTYQQIKTMYDYGLSKIYELVINTNPAYAFLLENNTILQNIVVAAHVLAHVDFFKHNAYFSRTDRQMLETASVHAQRMRQYEFEHGTETVERFLDAVLSIQEHVDPRLHIPAEPTEARKRPRLSPPATGGVRRGPPEGARVRSAAVPGRARPAPGGLAARRAAHGAHRAALLRAADADEGDERRLGRLLARAPGPRA